MLVIYGFHTKRYTLDFSVCVSFQLNDLNDDYEFSVQFTKNSRGLGFSIYSYIGDLNSGNNIYNISFNFVKKLANCHYSTLS